MKILVTGGSGFVGKVLVARLRTDGHNVVALCRNDSGNGVQCNLLDRKQSQKTLEKYKDFDCIIHTAALAHGQTHPEGQTVDEINFRMTKVLVDCLGNSCGMMLFPSSISVYGVNIGTEQVSLSMAPEPASAYGRGKLKCEQFLMDFGFNRFHCLRLPPVYDYKNMTDIKKRVYFPWQSFLKMRLIPSPVYSFLDVSNLAETVVHLIHDTRNGAWLHLLCDPKPTLQSDLLKMFPGIQVPVPLWLVSSMKMVNFFLPGKLRGKVNEIYAKLFMNTFFQSESIRFEESGRESK